MEFDPEDTIAAIASPPGPGLRGIVRLTGPASWSAARSVFTPDRPGCAEPPSFPLLIPGAIRDDLIASPWPARLAYWPGPRTYTGQPLAELHTSGSPPLLQRLLSRVLLAGARLAEPGEFTLRAFLSGRIDLTRAEAVAGVIEAANPHQLESALDQLAGGLTGPIVRMRDRLLDELAHLEAGLDFVDEADVDPIARADLSAFLGTAGDELSRLLDRLGSRDRPEGRARVVLIGPPNAGKSSLFNALLASEHAIVSDQAGTTRDALQADCRFGDIAAQLIDTAGDDEAKSGIDARAQVQRQSRTDAADLLLVCFPCASSPVDSRDTVPGGNVLRVATKADLAPEASPPGWFPTSVRTGFGLDRLREAIGRRLGDCDDRGHLVASTGARCRESLEQAYRAIADAADSLRTGRAEETIAFDLRLAVDELGKVVGAVVTDDILDRIFRRFCIGK